MTQRRTGLAAAFHIAITRASVTGCAVIAAFIDQPTTRRENRSFTQHRAGWFERGVARIVIALRSAPMTVDESKHLKNSSRVYWQGKATDAGTVTETSWDAVTIQWDNGHTARVLRGDLREVELNPTRPRPM